MSSLSPAPTPATAAADHRAHVVADAVVSAYILEIAAPRRQRRRPRTRRPGAVTHPAPIRRQPSPRRRGRDLSLAGHRR